MPSRVSAQGKSRKPPQARLALGPRASGWSFKEVRRARSNADPGSIAWGDRSRAILDCPLGSHLVESDSAHRSMIPADFAETQASGEPPASDPLERPKS